MPEPEKSSEPEHNNLRGKFAELILAYHGAGSVEACAHLDLKLAHVDIAVDYCGCLDREQVVDINVTFHRSEEVNVVADDASLDFGGLAYHYPAFGVEFALHLTVYPDIAAGRDVTADYYALSDAADLTRVSCCVAF